MIPERHDRQPVGRQIHKTLRSGVIEQGVVLEGCLFPANGQNVNTYRVRWTSAIEPQVTYEEVLALRTLQIWYSAEDTYENEPYVAEELRVHQKVTEAPTHVHHLKIFC